MLELYQTIGATFGTILMGLGCFFIVIWSASEHSSSKVCKYCGEVGHTFTHCKKYKGGVDGNN